MKELRVSALQDGTVIDHIAPSSVFKVVKILDAETRPHEVLIGTNLQSKKLGRKGIIKLSNVFLGRAMIDKIAILARDATIITIKDYEVHAKQIIQIPNVVTDIVRCFNPNCITNHESAITKFRVLDKDSLKLRCHYCEKIMHEPQIEFRAAA